MLTGKITQAGVAMAAAILALAGVGCAASSTTSSSDRVKPYTLSTCVVSDEKLGSMGDPSVVVYEGQEMKFCCPNCVTEFNKDPDKFISKMTQASKGSTTQPAVH